MDIFICAGIPAFFFVGSCEGSIFDTALSRYAGLDGVLDDFLVEFAKHHLSQWLASK